MAQKTNLNAAPYYDDFDKDKNYVRTLFRPGFAVQARELTQLQSQLQHQIEAHGSHIFKEGAMVVPGNHRVLTLATLKLATQFAGENIDPSKYYNATTPVTLTGATSGVKAQVIGFTTAADSGGQPLLHLNYIETGTDNTSRFFQDGENLSADVAIQHDAISYAENTASVTVFTATSTVVTDPLGPAARSGTFYKVSTGVIYCRGFFVTVEEQTIPLDLYRRQVNTFVGLAIEEKIITPEDETSLLDNAQGSSNFAAKGAHRLQINLTLTKKSTSTESDFIQLAQIKNGVAISEGRETEYSVLSQEFARRTFDESGNYTVRPFQFNVEECVTVNENEGRFTAGATTDDGNTASTDLLTIKVSPGKAYVNGFELDKKTASLKDLNKARDFETKNADITVFDTGNYALITNIYGTPDISEVSSEATPFQECQFYDTQNSSRGTANGTLIGVGRARSMSYHSGTAGATSSNTTSQYKLFLFDLRPFTVLTLSGTPSPTLTANHTDGVLVTGVTSGATGLVFGEGTSTTNVNLTNVIGTFSAGEKITASDSSETDSIVENSSNADLTISSITTYSFQDFKQIFMNDADAGQDFTADIVLDNQLTLSGTYRTETTGTDNLIGVSGYDTSEVKVGDILEIPTGTAGATEERVVDGITSTAISFTAAPTTDAITTANVIRKRSQLKDAEKNIALFKPSKRVVKTHLTEANGGASDTQYTIRRQFVGTTSTGAVTFSAGTNETFNGFAEGDYTLSILTAGTGTGVQGDIISLDGKVSGTGSGSLTVTDASILGNGAKVKLLATTTKTSVTQKNKTVQLMKQVKVTPGTTDAYGTRPTDRDISLGRADVFKLVAVFDSEDTSTDAVAPELTTGSITGTFIRGEKITGTGGATGRIIDTTSPFSYVLTSTTDFVVGDVITGESSSATATVSAVTAGDTVITSNFLLDTGQRDNFYDISRLVRKPGVVSPEGRLLIVHDYMEHGTGDLMTVDSYTDVANQMDYEDIPSYNASRVDPDDPQPAGSYPLYETYDFRPRVADIAGASATLSTVDEITGNSFDFTSRVYTGTGSSYSNFCKPASNVQSDLEYYLPKRASLFLDDRGNIIIREGASSEQPRFPEPISGTMKLADFDIPAFTFKPQDVTVERQKTQRFTMRDIGKIEERLTNVERVTTLSLLEKDAQSFEVTDANGLNRFKSGFVVDPFRGHSVGDVRHPDYRNSMDFEIGELRPIHKTRGVDLEEVATTDGQRTTAGYQKTGDLITLPYTEVVFTEQPFATTIERVTPFLSASWEGIVELDPDQDSWFETEIAPQLIINVEGNYDAVAAAARNQLGTVWNSWQTTWSGSVTTQFQGQRRGLFGLITRTVTSGTQRRTGTRTTVQEQIDRESQGFRVIGRAAIPVVRARAVNFTARGMRPRTRIYAYFDGRSIDAYITPDADSTSDATPVAGSPLIVTSAGKLNGVFNIPDPKIAGNPQFQTGTIEFKLSSNTTTSDIGATTMAVTTYEAQGVLVTEQETIIATRNARIAQESVSQTRATSRVSENIQSFPPFGGSGDDGGDGGDGGDGPDPIAQTFIVSDPDKNQEGSGSTDNGKFLTSVDLFFQSKAENIDIFVEVRNVINGSPGPLVLPFGRRILSPSEVNVSDDGKTATKFTFPSPVYVQSETEYALVVGTNSPDYRVWISDMGQEDSDGNLVSEQPHVGVLFKSHNNRSWAISPTQDLKFTLRTAKFDTSAAGAVTLQNTTLPALTLAKNPLVMTNGSTTMKVNHFDHGMHSTSNNVTISGVVSGAETTLNGAIGSDATAITLTSGTNFDDTTGKWAPTASGSIYYIKIDDEIISYTSITGNNITGATRGVGGTTAAAHSNGATVELYMLHKVPFTEVNKTHTAIANPQMDSYTISLSTTPVVASGADSSFGGTAVTATENYMYDVSGSVIGTLTPSSTSILAKVRPTTATSASGSQSSFTQSTLADAEVVPLNDNYYYEVPYMIASEINETNEMSGGKSLFVPLTLSSTNDSVSPVIDSKRLNFLAITNRIDEIDSSSDVYPTSDYVPMTDPDGDNHSAIYLTKRVTLENAATSLRVLFDANREDTADIKVLYKILRTDDANDFDELDYKFFNDDGTVAGSGGPDVSVSPSLGLDQFNEYEFTAGVTDDGIGTPLDEFIAFQIKIVMRATNSARPPRIKDLRILALAT